MRYASTYVIVVALAACAADVPSIEEFDTGPAPPSAITVAPRDNCPAVDPAASIARVESPATTSAQRQAIRGVAVGAADVIARSGTKIHGVGSTSSDGRFCVEADLVVNTQTEVELIPRLPDGCWGQPRRVVVTHQFTAGAPTSGPSPVPIAAPQNLALGKPVYSPFLSLTSGGGGAMAVTDGNTESFAVFSTWDVLATKSVWLRVDLGQTQTISEFRIDWDTGTDSSWARSYTILTSVAGDPADPTTSVSLDWTEAVTVRDAKWGTQQRRVGAIPARWVALLMHDDDAYIKDTFNVAEFGVYSATNQGIPIGGTSSGVDSCP